MEFGRAYPLVLGQAGCASRLPWDNKSQDDGIRAQSAGQSETLAAIVNNHSPYNPPSFSNVQWYAPQTGGGLITDLCFSSSQPWNMTLLVRSTSNALALGWYGVDSSGKVVDGGALVDSSTAVGSTMQFMPTTTTWGLFLKYGFSGNCTGKSWDAACAAAPMPQDLFYSQVSRSSSIANPAPRRSVRVQGL